MKRSLLVVAVLTIAMSLVPKTFAAKTAPTIAVAPFLQQVQIQASEPTKTFTIALTNDTDQLQSFHISALDFGSLDETGGVAFAGSNATSLIKKYGLASWLQLATNQVTLAPRQTSQLSVTITNDTSLQPGAHYAAIISTLDNPGAGSGSQVSIKQQLSALVLATKIGGERYDLSLQGATTNTSWRHLPTTVTLRFRNPGNVHVVPRGVVKLVGPGGRVVSQGVINEDSSFVLPETYRQLPVELHSVGTVSPLPALYHLQVDYRYDGFDRFATKTFPVHYVNLPSLIVGGCLLAVLVWFIHKLWRRKRRQHKSPPTSVATVG